MGMSLGDSVRVTLFGESHGTAVGAFLEGVPPGIPINVETLIAVSYTHLTLPTILRV